MSIIPSPMQQRIFEWVQHQTGSTIINAVAGSGKTTTILQALDYISPNKKVLFLAFNASIATKLATKVPDHADAKTFHALGMYAYRKRHNKFQVGNSKVRKLLGSFLDARKKEWYGEFIVKLVSLAKQHGFGVLEENSLESWKRLSDKFGIHTEYDLDYAVKACQSILERSNHITNVIDFDDMIYLPLLFRYPIKKHDWVFVDEAQDTNPVRRELARQALKTDGRLVAVGDPHQAIYGFTGASSDSMSRLQQTFNATTLPLSVSYRCSQRVVREAQRLVPHIQPWEQSPAGSVTTVDSLDFGTLNPRNSIVLCRNTTPLVELSSELIAQGIGFNILGKETGTQLVRLIRNIKAGTPKDLLDKLHKQYQRMEELKKSEAQLAQLKEHIKCVAILVVRVTGITELIDNITTLFAANNHNALTLSTVHKSKGLEWDNVVIIRPDLMPAKQAKLAWERQSEDNIKYVAVTRAKDSLIFVNSIRE